MEDIKSIIESLLFISETPLTVERIKRVIHQADTKDIKAALDHLAEEYATRKGGFYLREVAGGFQFCTRPEHEEWVKRFVQPNPKRFTGY